jgi:uncharacterized protein (DUF2147 family)
MEAPMKKTLYLAAAAALLMASTNAHAGSGLSFEIDGQKIHINAPRNCSSLSCLSVTNNGSAVNLKNVNLKGKKSADDDDDVATTSAPAKAQQPASAPAPAPLPVASNPPPPPPPAPVASNVPPPPAPPAPVSDSGTRERISGLPATTEVRAPAATTTAPVAPAPVASNNPPAAQAAPVAQAAPPAAAPTTPVGLWQTADNKGNVRIEQCGTNLCGYSEHTNEKILINMKPSDSKWTGRIHDPDSGSNYDSTIAMKGPNVLKVQGCAFGGLFCGGQTWKRIS